MYDSILVATDGSDDAMAAESDAVSLASAFDAALYGIAVVETRTDYDSGLIDPDEAEQRLRERAEESLERLENVADEAALSATTTIRSGTPSEEVLEYAEEVDADVIVVGATGRSSFRRALLGSTADRIVRSASSPVLVVDEEENSDDDH